MYIFVMNNFYRTIYFDYRALIKIVSQIFRYIKVIRYVDYDKNVEKYMSLKTLKKTNIFTSNSIAILY